MFPESCISEKRLSNLDEIERKIQQIEEEFLNEDQIKAVEILQKESLQSDHFLLPIVEGPPGTGKTTTGAIAVAKKLTSLAREGINGRYLVLCFTHAACIEFKKKLEWVGIKETDAVYLTPYSRDTDPKRGIFGVPHDLAGLPGSVQRWLGNSPVIITTLLGISRAITSFWGKRIYLMIDEFSQVSAADFFACIYHTKNLRPYQFSLLGDPLQLPVVTTQTHLRPNICTFINPHGRGTATIGLKTQYRMHEDICNAINEMRRIFHAFPLQPADWVANRTLTKMRYRWKPPQNSIMRKILDPNNPLVLIDTGYLGFEDSRGREIKFEQEAKLAVKIAIEAARSYQRDGEHLRPQILTPYSAQRGIISSMLPKECGTCTTIYKAQGAEYPMVIISFVRSNPQRFIGFLDDGQLAEQVYVGCSRAQAKLIVLLSFDTFFGGGHLMFQALERTSSAIKIRGDLKT